MILCLFKSVGLAKMISLFDSLKSVKMTNGAAAQIAQMAQIVQIAQIVHNTAQHLADDAWAKAGNAETCR